MAHKTLLVEILGEAKQFAKELDHAAGKTRQMSKVAGVAGLAIAGGLAVGLEKSVEAAIHGQASQAALDTALKNTHQSVEAMKGPLEEAEAASRKLGFADDDTRSALAKLEIATGSTKEAIKEMAVAEDLARFKHISLEAATKSLTMLHAGSTRAIKQLGIATANVTREQDRVKAAFDKHTSAAYKTALADAKVADKQATAAGVLKQVTDLVHGQSTAYAGTAQGGMAQFHAQTEKLQETLGNTLLPGLTVVAEKLASLGSFMSSHTETAKVLIGALAGLAAVLLTVSAATKIVEAAQAIATAATAAWTAAQWLLNIALDANPIGLVVIAVAALVAGIIIAYKESATFREIVAGALSAVSGAAQAVLDFFRSNWPVITTLISGPFAPLVALATDAFGIRSAIVGAFEAVKSAGATLGSRILDGIVNGLVGVATAVANKIQAVVDAIGAFFGNMYDKASTLGGRILAGVISGVTGIATEVGARIQNVIDALAGFLVAINAKGTALGNALHDAFIGALSGIGGVLVRIFKAAINAVIDVWNDFHIPAIKVFGHQITPAVNFPNIPHLAAGGIVTGPTLALIGERGPEAVVPLGRGGGGGENHYHFHFPNLVATERSEIERIVTAAVVRANRRGNLLASDLA